MGRCNRADCNHHVSFRTWHFLCKRTRLSEGRRRADIPERNSRLVLTMFPGSDALLSCNHHSNAGSGLPAQYCSRSSLELDAESLSDFLLQALSKTEQFGSDTRNPDIVDCMHSRDGNRARLRSPQSLPCGAAWASTFLNLQPQYRPLRYIFFECLRGARPQHCSLLTSFLSSLSPTMFAYQPCQPWRKPWKTSPS